MSACMDWVLIGGIVMTLWAATRVLGNERQRRIDDQSAIEAAALAALSAEAATPAETAHGSH